MFILTSKNRCKYYGDYKLGFFLPIVQECLNGLVISERIETVIPMTYLICFLMGWYGPNAEFLGSINLTLWHHLAVTDLDGFLQNLCLCVFVDFMSFVCNSVILWTTVGINTMKILKKIQEEFWLIFAIQEAALIVEVYISAILYSKCIFTFINFFIVALCNASSIEWC